MQDVVDSNLCIGCGACELACPVEAIRIVFDSFRGQYVPTVDETCTFCHNCFRVCFGSNVNISEMKNLEGLLEDSLGMHINCYSGYSTDCETRFNASSGGIITALLESMLASNEIDGAIVAVSHRRNPIKSYSKIAVDTKEIHRAMGSKYNPVLLSPALKKLKKKKKYAFVGLPCQIFAIKELQKLKRIPDSIKTFVSLLCGGTMSYNGTKYILRSMGLERTSIQSIRYRGNGWPGHLSVRTTSGEERSVPYVTYWPLTARWFYLHRCMICIEGFGKDADISCGDYWIPTIMEKDIQGTSVIITRTSHGNEIIEKSIRNLKIECSRVDWKSVKKSQCHMFEFKHKKLASRLRLLNLMHQKHPYQIELTSVMNVYQKEIFDEILTAIGRVLASYRLWSLLDLYKSLLNNLFNMTNSIRNRIREKR